MAAGWLPVLAACIPFAPAGPPPAARTATPVPSPTAVPLQYVLIGRSHGGSWVAVELITETAGCLKDGTLGALITSRPYEQGMLSVLALDSLARQGALATMQAYHFDTRRAQETWVIDAGVEIVSAQGAPGTSLAEYAARLDVLGIPHGWLP